MRYSLRALLMLITAVAALLGLFRGDLIDAAPAWVPLMLFGLVAAFAASAFLAAALGQGISVELTLIGLSLLAILLVPPLFASLGAMSLAK